MNLADIQRHVGVAADGKWGPNTAAAIAKALGIGAAPRVPASFDSTAFFEHVRKLTGGLEQVAVDSINAILKRMAGMPIQHIAYVLATAWHEARFKPQREWGLGKGKRYGKPGARMKPKPGAPTYGDQIPYGRGLVQTTWLENYEWLDAAATEAGLIKQGDLLRNFDLALRPDIAVLALVKGMLEAAFASNGKPLSHYGPKPDGSFDYRAARQTVNVMDKADLIAGHARHFEKSLRAGGLA